MSTEQYPKLYLYRRIVQAKFFIDRHYAADIDLDNIAEEAYFSKFHFIRLFKKAYCKTPYQYLIFVRVEKAKDLIKSGTSIIDACYMVGFESVTSFSGLFKRMTGLTPSAFQQKHLHQQSQVSDSPFKFIPGCFASANRKSNFEEVQLVYNFSSL